MRKLGALFYNEMLKSKKKVSVYIIVIVMTVGMIGCSILIKETNRIVEDINSYHPITDNIQYAETLNLQIRDYEKKLENENLTSEEQNLLKEELYYLKCEYIHYDIYGNYAKENEIGTLSYRYMILGDLVNIRQQQLSIEFYSGDSSSEEYQQLQKQYEELESSLKVNNYQQYIQTKNRQIEEDTSLTDAQKEAQISYNQALLSVCPSGEYASEQEKMNAESLLSEKSNINASLANNVDLNGAGNLTAERRAILEKNLKLVEAKIEKGFLQEDPDNSIGGEAYVLASSLGFVFTVVILIIIAGSMMSHEMSTGTIKSLIIAPVKRWKIYLAKYLSLIATMVLLILYTYGISSLTNGLLFGFSSFGEKVFIVSGNAVTMNYFSYQFLSALCNLVPLFIFATFAYTLSIVTKNTAASVSVSMGLYLGGSFLHLLLESSLSGYAHLLKFLPFSNLSLFGKIFYSSSGTQNIGGVLFGNIANTSSVSLVFSIFYNIIILICMISIGMDHFCRRDIK